MRATGYTIADATDVSNEVLLKAGALQSAIFNSANFSSIATDATGVNAYVVKPMNLHAFVDAVRQVGAFWAVVNEVPGSLRQAETMAMGTRTTHEAVWG